MQILYRQKKGLDIGLDKKESDKKGLGIGLDKNEIKYLKRYIGERKGWLAVILCIIVIMAGIMFFNGVPAAEIGYGLALCVFMTAAAVLAGYGRHWESLWKLEQLRENITMLSNEMKAPEYLYEEQYQDCIRALVQEKDRLRNEMRKRQQNMAAYYSMWVHQIKTPIAALKLLIDEDLENCFELADETQENDTRVRKEQLKWQELFRIEQYADMALQYTRLGTESNDFVFEHVVLDEVIRCSVRKYAKQFIHKKLRLCYEPQEIAAVTDRKWLGFVVDQLLSNAVKYTKEGSVTARVFCGQEDLQSVHIVIEDTGIGIRAEDLPRVCEMGYTGYNGHADRYSTGIGLYLCKAILDKLGHRLLVASNEGEGTRVEIVIAGDDTK